MKRVCLAPLVLPEGARVNEIFPEYRSARKRNFTWAWTMFLCLHGQKVILILVLSSWPLNLAI